MKCNYSIIIPHHNIPNLLNRCLLSIPHRDDVEVIVVDDYSGKEFQLQLKGIERDFPWVSFFYLQEGKGAGHARNIGLSHAKGKYVLFADSDDFFNYCINDILEQYKNEDTDVVYFNANSLDTDTYEVTIRNRQLSRMIKAYHKHPQKAVFQLKYVFGEPWCKMVKRDIIEQNNIRFEETIIHNDTAYSYLVGHFSKTVKVDSRCLYCVTDRKGSVSRQVSIDRLLVRTQVFSNANRFFRLQNIPRFEEKAFRPMMQFLVKGDFTNYKKCMSLIKESGMSSLQILMKQLCYPFYLFEKVIRTIC